MLVLKNLIPHAVVLGGALLLTAPAQAENYDLKVISGKPSAAQLTESLAMPPKSRGIRKGPVKQKAVALQIQFEFGSTELTADAKGVLDTVGSVLRSSRLSSNQFLIEGHTDAVGTGDYNRQLSRQRAAAVKEYLVSRVGVSPDRLRTIGRGEDNLLDQSNPRSGKNRRVQFVNVTN
jgi:outer membrane protein OmpA-like peptidoglycan-associated protein